MRSMKINGQTRITDRPQHAGKRMEAMKRITHIAFALAMFTGLAISPAASQTATPPDQSSASQSSAGQSSLGDYARKVHKDPAAKAKPKVYDNDNLPSDDKLSVVGDARPTENAQADAGPKTADGAAPITADDDQAKKQAEWKTWQGKLTAQKDAIDLASRELDVAQKEYQLRAAAMYADAGNRLRNSSQWDKEEADFKQKIADKQKAVDDGKQKLEEMQEEARKVGVPAAMREP
jgi:hypothetical protein